jgi:hypothetical protein
VLFASHVNKLDVSEEAMIDALNENNARVEAGPDAPEVATCPALWRNIMSRSWKYYE